MAKKSKKKSSNHINDEITDERFIAAATRPQFQKAKRGSHHHHNKSSTTTKSKSNNNAKLDGDNNDGALISTTNNHDTQSGLGVSLTQAIQSDDRFAAALNSDKFGCVPSRDKYGRKVKKTKKKKNESEDRGDAEERDSESDVESVEETDKKSKKKKSHKDDSDSDVVEQDNSMEARIAYLNALSRGDISASSSSESDSEEVSDDDDSDDDDDSSTSSTNVRGKSGVFDPNYKSLPGEAQHNSDDEGVELTDEPSPHLCILNLNWEHVRAVDVYAMLHSFCPPGTLKHVEVYPSDFGKERMEKERMEGPGFAGLWKKDKKSKKQKSDGEDDEDDDSGSDSDEESETNGSSEQHPNSDNDEDASESNDDDGSEDEEDVLNLAEATSKLYAHFPPQSTVMKNSQLTTQDEEEEGFDIEKLREYEASKLRYYFAIATFSTPQAAEVVYENVDGMEMENSASEIDVRVLPSSQYSSTIEGRELRDNCNALPAKYVPPENVVTTALRQSRVTCSWETGDADRERKLTKYGMGKDAWEALAEGDDIKFYLATSDNSSASESDVDEEVDETEATKSKKKKKGSNMRAMLGLAGSDSEEEEEENKESRKMLMDDQSISEDSSSGSDSDGSSKDNNKQQSKKKLVSTESESESDEDEAKNKTSTKQVTFTPGKHNLEQKIRSKLQSKQGNINGELLGSDDDGGEKLSPYQKYLEKRKEKRRERRQAARGARKGKNAVNEDSDNDNMNQDDDNDGMYGVDPEFGIAQFSDEESNEVAGGEDDNDGGDGFFLGEKKSSSNKSKNGKADKQMKMAGKGIGSNDKVASTKEELELLIAGDDGESSSIR